MLQKTFTALELAAIEGLAEGLQSKEIAMSVNRSVARVESVVQTLYLKLGARSRAHIESLDYRGGLLPKRLNSFESGGIPAFAEVTTATSLGFHG